MLTHVQLHQKRTLLGQRQTTANELINLLKIDSCNLDVVEKETLVRVISEHHNAFSIDDKKQGRTSLVEHSIDTEEALPIRHQPRRMSDEQKRKVDKLIDEMQQTGVINCSNSAWSSPIVLVR